MAIINSVSEVLHRIRVKLYPNYLSTVEGAYITRTDNEASLSIEEICAALKNRGGFTGSYDDLVEHVRQFFDETAYQLCDGFAVNTGYFSIHPNVGGTFDKTNEGHNARKHPVTFRFRSRAPLRNLAEHIVVEVEGIANVSGYIDEFMDVTAESVNDVLTPGGQFSIAGHKIKVAGDKPEIGVYFTSTTDSAKRIKVQGHLAENALEIVTQYSSGSTFLKEPRVLEFAGELTVNSNNE
ncbi:MAG: DUF4469 domain-containing protein [Treponema sp.]|jgi:hypothetical protein|nr:DUF4469 domain-containing protein [Treponema sp.]